MQLFQEFILSQWLILIALVIVFFAITRWALAVLNEYAGYGLGWMIGLFFIIVRLSVANPSTSNSVNLYLNGFQVFIATIFGLLIGSVIILGLRFGMRHARAIALQVAIYTAMNVIMIFLVFISNPIVQKMIGIFGLAIGIATLFAMVLFPTPEREEQLNIRAKGVTGTQPQTPQQGFPGPNNPQGQGGGTSRLDEIRKSQNKRLRR